MAFHRSVAELNRVNIYWTHHDNLFCEGNPVHLYNTPRSSPELSDSIDASLIL